MIVPTIIYRIIYFIDKCIIIIYLSWLLRGRYNEYEILLLAPIGFASTKYPYLVFNLEIIYIWNLYIQYF